jgi:Pectobacterium phage endonuclease
MPRNLHQYSPAICQFCSATFMARHDALKNGKGLFCSRRCAAHFRIKPFLEYVDKSGGPNACWPWRGYIEPKNGYGRIVIAGRKILAHRAVYEKLVGPILPGFDLLHSCDNPPCCNPRHLSPGTHAHNMVDMARKGRAKPPCGEASPNAKLTIDKVLIARQRLAAGETCTAIAKDFGVSFHTIFDIKRGRSWTHVQAQPLHELAEAAA